MRYPAYTAFTTDYRDSEHLRTVRRWCAGLAAVYSVLALLILAFIAMSAAIAAEPAGAAECAARDLRLVISIEAHGEAQDVPASHLRDAVFRIMDARKSCAAGRIDEAFTIYDQIAIVLASSGKE